MKNFVPLLFTVNSFSILPISPLDTQKATVPQCHQEVHNSQQHGQPQNNRGKTSLLRTARQGASATTPTRSKCCMLKCVFFFSQKKLSFTAFPKTTTVRQVNRSVYIFARSSVVPYFSGAKNALIFLCIQQSNQINFCWK